MRWHPSCWTAFPTERGSLTTDTYDIGDTDHRAGVARVTPSADSH